MGQMPEAGDKISVADIVGPWVEAEQSSGLIERCRTAWCKPLHDLSRGELATLLRQGIAIEHVLPIAKRRVQDHREDDTEMSEAEL